MSLPAFADQVMFVVALPMGEASETGRSGRYFFIPVPSKQIQDVLVTKQTGFDEGMSLGPVKGWATKHWATEDHLLWTAKGL